MHPDPVWIPIIALCVGAICGIGIPIARAYGRKIDRGPSQTSLPPDVTMRLERMEQAIESIAIEVERISEGQRFTTKLLSERPTGAASLPSAPPS